MKNILIIEDDPNTLSGLIELFRDDGFIVRGTTNGFEALEIAATEPVNVVICDYKLPDMNGLNVCQKIKEIVPNAHIFIISIPNISER